MSFRENANLNWIEQQKILNNASKIKLNCIAPILQEYFEKAHNSIKYINKLLQNDTTKSAEQIKAINMSIDNEKKLNILQVKHTDNDDEKKNDLQNEDNANSDKENKKYFETKQINSVIIKNNEVNKLKDECNSLKIAALLSLYIIENMKDKFQPNDINKEIAYSLASYVQACCIEIIESLFNIRQSVLIGKELIKYKPIKLTETSKPICNVIASTK